MRISSQCARDTLNVEALFHNVDYFVSHASLIELIDICNGDGNLEYLRCNLACFPFFSTVDTPIGDALLFKEFQTVICWTKF